jgi:hypothetical protein
MKSINLAAAAFVAFLWLAGPANAQISVGTTSITFNGFCDGATITYSSGSFISGTHDNWDCQRGQTFIEGVSGQDLKMAPGEGSSHVTVANMADNVGVLGLNADALQLYLDFNKKTYSFYEETNGVLPETLVNQGGFKIVGSPVSSTGGVPAWQGPVTDNPGPNPGSAYPRGRYYVYLYDFSSDQYCDYFQLTTNGNRVGGLHLATDCASGQAPVAANDSSLAVDVDGTSGASLITTDNELFIDYGYDAIVSFYFNFATQPQTWTLYLYDQTGFVGINSGIFTLVPSGAFAQIRPPSGAGLPAAAAVHLP